MVKKTFLLLLSLMFILTVGGFAEQYQGPVPTKFNESPVLKELVEKGELPPVEERLPQDPYVVDPVEMVGTYGGTVHMVSTSKSPNMGVGMISDSYRGFVKPGPGGKGVVINFARKVDVSEDKTTFTIYLRRGVKWSDGYPFTADDIMFWYNDVLLNPELTPSINPSWKASDEVVTLTEIDDYTVQFKFAQSQPYFLEYPLSLTTASNPTGYPKHYLKQFHPAYVPAEELQKKVEAEGYSAWYELFQRMNERWEGVSARVGRPTLAPYLPVKITSTRRIYERNPYFWKVDKAGNQLPYTDRVETDVVANYEVVNGKVISGDVDFL